MAGLGTRSAFSVSSTLILIGLLLGSAVPASPQQTAIPDDWSGSSKEDPGTREVPKPEYPLHPTKQDQKLKPFTGNPVYLDSPGLYVGAGPRGASYPLWNPIPAAGCSGYTTNVIPVGLARIGNGRYLSYGGDPGTRIIPVGVSPDNGCHLFLGDPTSDVHKCEQEIDWRTAINNLGQAGLNKLRLWVSLGSANDRRNTPFAYDGRFHLDQKNQPFFDTLRSVVNQARQNFMFVEITFFAPFEADVAGNSFTNGPWGGKGVWNDPNRGGALTPISFSGVNNFVLNAQSGDNLTMQEQFQYNVIKWTIDELWCFDNVWYEIANEPEKANLLPARVVSWEQTRVANVVALDTTQNYPFLLRPHLIAVETLTQVGANEFTGPNDPNVSIVNGHYTDVLNGNDDSGAIVHLARDNAAAAKVLGFNETKITGSGASAVGNGFSRSVTNGSSQPQYGVPEPGRAEAYEFMLTRGSTVDHFGYLSPGNPGSYGPITAQMASLRTFAYSLPLGRLVASTDPPSWVPGLNAHPDPFNLPLVGWNSTKGSYRYWGAMQTPDGTPSSRFFALYIHNSAPRCFESPPSFVNFDPSSKCNGNFLAFRAYDARVWTSSQYQETLTLQLGTAGTFDLFWMDPATLNVVSQQTCVWDGASCGFPVTSPSYQYDILLKLQER